MENRKHEIKIRLSAKELADLNAKVKQTHLSREQFCRCTIAGKEVRQAPPADVPRLIREVRRVGTTLNQILKIANCRGLLEVPDLRKALEDNRAVEKMSVSAYEG